MISKRLKFFLRENQTEYLSMLAHSGMLSDAEFEIITNELQYEGEWREFGYNQEDDEFGYNGIIPACFWLVALCFNNKLPTRATEILRHKTANALLNRIRSGSIRKTTYNHNDVLNTSLLAAYSLVVYSDTTQNPNSYKAKIIEIYARRIVYRAMLSQHQSGAFPYQSNSRHISMLYHYMVVALLQKLNERWENELLNYSIKRSQKFLEKTIVDDEIDWSNDTSGDKIGAVWAYFWLAVAGRELPNYHLQLDKLQAGMFLNGEDGNENLRYTAWCTLANIIKTKKISGSVKINQKTNGQILSTLKYMLFSLDKMYFHFIIKINKTKIKLRHFIFKTGHELN